MTMSASGVANFVRAMVISDLGCASSNGTAARATQGSTAGRGLSQSGEFFDLTGRPGSARSDPWPLLVLRSRQLLARFRLTNHGCGRRAGPSGRSHGHRKSLTFAGARENTVTMQLPGPRRELVRAQVGPVSYTHLTLPTNREV